MRGLTLSIKATKIFNRLIALLEASLEGDFIKIDNTEGTFMPISIEKLRETEHGTVYSLTHYTTQGGDLCKDPDMEFLHYKGMGIIPMTFTQDLIPPIHTVAVFTDEENKLKCYRKPLRDLVSFANIWLNNIKAQQGI